MWIRNLDSLSCEFRLAHALFFTSGLYSNRQFVTFCCERILVEEFEKENEELSDL